MPEIHQVKCNFTEPAANPDYIARSLNQLCFNLYEKLTIQNLGARKLDLIFHRVDNSAQAIRVGTVSPSHEPGHYMRLLSEHLDKVEYGYAWILWMSYIELQVTTNFSFLRGASHPDELFAQAQGSRALGITDRNSLAGMVRAHEAALETGVN